jgi:hypothetical protein
MEKKLPWEKYMDELSPESEIINVYRKLRKAFRREGWTQEDLVRPPYYPNDIMDYSRKMSHLIDELKNELTLYFSYIDKEEFNDYLMNKLKHIDLEIPLQDGNTERNNSRDEDY